MRWGSEILELRTQGLSYRDIERKLGCSRAVISYHCTKSLMGAPIPARKDPLPASKQAALILLLTEGVRRTDIADALDISKKDVLEAARQLCLPEKAKAESSYLRVKRRRYQLKLLAVVSKGGKCEECGYSKSLHALDFHHIDPAEKDFTVSANTNRAWSVVKAEIAKCRLLCANCHRELHQT